MKTFILILNILVGLAVYIKTGFPGKDLGKVTQQRLTTLKESYTIKRNKQVENEKYCPFQNRGRIKSKIKVFKPKATKTKLGQHNKFTGTVFNGKKRKCRRILKRRTKKTGKRIYTKLNQMKDKEFINSEKLDIAISRVRRNTQGCFEDGACKNNVYEDIPVCYCDLLCNLYNDCCHDNNFTNETANSEIKYISMKLKYMSCEHVIPHLSDQLRGYLFVTKCPESELEKEYREICENETYSVPVTGYDGLSYKNEYCAMCHDVNVFLKWNISYMFDTDCRITLNELLNIKYSGELLQLFKSKRCLLHAIPPTGKIGPRICWSFDLNNLEFARNKTSCMRYQNPVAWYVPGRYMWERNVFCLDKHETGRTYCAYALNRSGFGVSVHRMSALFDFNRQDKSHNSHNCFEGVKDECKFEANIGNCELDIQVRILTNGSYGIWVRILGLSQVIIERLLIPWKTKKIELEPHLQAINNRDDFPCLNSLNCLLINLKLFMTINESVSLAEVTEFLKGLRQMKWTYIEKDRNTLWNYTITTFDFSILKVDIPENAKTFNYLEFLKFTNVLKQQIDVFKENLTTFPKYLEVIGGHNADKNGKNGEFKILDISFTFSETVKYPSDTETQSIGFNWNIFQIISTYVTMGTSTVLLVLTLVIHRYLRLSRNNAGKVSEHFMIVMIFSHVLFMFGFGADDYPKLCFVIGIVSHYVWLSCFAWMTNFTFLLMIAMLKLKQNPNMSSTNLLPGYYNLIGYGVPFLFVVPSTLLDIFSETKIGYASDTCFPSKYPYNIIVFVGPISLSLLINVVALIVAGYVIYRFRQSIENNSSAIETRSYWPVYLRFFLFSGLTWSLGIISEATDQDILRILFIFLAGSHGFSYSVLILISSQVQSKLRSIRGRSQSSIETTN